MQGLSPPPSPGPNLDAPRPNRVKRSRVLSPDLDVDLDCFFRSKRFMTEAVTKEMEDVLISDPPLTTSPSRTSTLTRLAERGPSRSNIAGVLDFDAPKLSIGSGGRRRHLVVKGANDVPSPRSHYEGSLSGSGGMRYSDFEDDLEDEEEENVFSPLEWRLPPSSPRPKIPRPIPVENALQRLIEKKKEAEAKQVAVFRSPSDIIKDAAQNALYARLRSQSSSPPGARHIFSDEVDTHGVSEPHFASNSRYPVRSIPRSISLTHTHRPSIIVEELPDDPSDQRAMPIRRPSYADFMAIDEDSLQSQSPPPSSSGSPSLRTSGSFSRAAAQLGQFTGFGGGYNSLNRSSSSIPRSAGSPPPRFSMFSDDYMDTDSMELSTTPPLPTSSIEFLPHNPYFGANR